MKTGADTVPAPGKEGVGPSPDTPAARDPRIASGTCYVLFAFEVGLGIRLQDVPSLLNGWSLGAAEGRTPPPRYLDFKVTPLRVLQPSDPVTVAGWTTAPEVEAVVFDFGSVSLTYRLGLHGRRLSDLVALSSSLYEHPELMADARRRVRALVEAIAPAVNRSRIADFVEDYSIFQVAAWEDRGLGPAAVTANNGEILAQILRSETRPLSSQEIEHALESRIAYGVNDEAIVDWAGAVLFQEDISDIRTVLEYANVELLEMRWLDDQLDLALDRSYEVLAKEAEHPWRRRFPLIPHKEISEIARLQTDSALLLEGVTNALKFAGDPFLARLYRLTARHAPGRLGHRHRAQAPNGRKHLSEALGPGRYAPARGPGVDRHHLDRDLDPAVAVTDSAHSGRSAAGA
jgi:hypothetical protein